MTLKNVIADTIALACPTSVDGYMRATMIQRTKPPKDVTIVVPMREIDPTRRSRLAVSRLAIVDVAFARRLRIVSLASVGFASCHTGPLTELPPRTHWRGI
jgi:hypothetical protein